MKPFLHSLLLFLILLLPALSRLEAQDEFPLNVQVTATPGDKSADDDGSTTDSNKLTVKALVKNTGIICLTDVTLKLYVMVSKGTSQGGAPSDIEVGRTFTCKGLSIPTDTDVNVNVGELILNTYTATNAFGASQDKANYDGYVVKFFQDGKCIGMRGSDRLALYQPVIARQEGNLEGASPDSASVN